MNAVDLIQWSGYLAAGVLSAWISVNIWIARRQLKRERAAAKEWEDGK